MLKKTKAHLLVLTTALLLTAPVFVVIAKASPKNATQATKSLTAGYCCPGTECLNPECLGFQYENPPTSPYGGYYDCSNACYKDGPGGRVYRCCPLIGSSTQKNNVFVPNGETPESLSNIWAQPIVD